MPPGTIVYPIWFRRGVVTPPYVYFKYKQNFVNLKNS